MQRAMKPTTTACRRAAAIDRRSRTYDFKGRRPGPVVRATKGVALGHSRLQFSMGLTIAILTRDNTHLLDHIAAAESGVS
jgi:hypothetical protein